MRRLAAFLPALAVLPALADTVTLKDGSVLKGRITRQDKEALQILTPDRGPYPVPAAQVKAVEKGSSVWDRYDKEAAKSPDTPEGHLDLGRWCLKQGLPWQAEEEMAKAGSAEELGKLREARAVGLVLTAAYPGDTDKAFLASFGERAKEASRFMWELTEGQMYVRQITVADKGGKGDFKGKPDFTIVNLDQIRAKPGEYYAITRNGTIEAPGKILAYTFFHELMHLKFEMDHCLDCKECIMSSEPTADRLCDDADHRGKRDGASPSGAVVEGSCWGRIRKLVKDRPLRPLLRDPKRPPGPPPETRVLVLDH